MFYNKETGEVKIAYVPVENSSEALRKNIVKFLLDIKADVKDDRGGYIGRIAKHICSSNYYIRDIINKIGIYRREIYILNSRKNAN